MSLADGGKQMDVVEITIKSALVRSRIPGVDYVINPYLGCGHGCSYCYAAFMCKHSHHHATARWGSFVEVKANIAEVLRDELRRKRKVSSAMLSSVCDPYQPLERRYRLTRQCLELLRHYGWGIEILTRSPLVARDEDLLAGASVGVSIPTNRDEVRRLVEPNSPHIESRVAVLRRLHGAGIHTWAFIGPMLPMDPEQLHETIDPHVDEVLIDKLNYAGRVRRLFLSQGWREVLSDGYAERTAATLMRLFGDKAECVFQMGRRG